MLFILIAGSVQTSTFLAHLFFSVFLSVQIETLSQKHVIVKREFNIERPYIDSLPSFLLMANSLLNIFMELFNDSALEVYIL